MYAKVYLRTNSREEGMHVCCYICTHGFKQILKVQ